MTLIAYVLMFISFWGFANYGWNYSSISTGLIGFTIFVLGELIAKR
jgi:hypothetical protein